MQCHHVLLDLSLAGDIGMDDVMGAGGIDLDMAAMGV